MVVNQALSDEIEAMNAIFGEGTIQTTGSTASKTTVIIRVPDSSHEIQQQVADIWNTTFTNMVTRVSTEPDLSFLVEFPSDYPISMPRIAGIDSVSMFEYSDRQLWKHELALGVLLQTIAVPENECIFDLLSVCGPVLACLDKKGINWAKLKDISPDLSLDEDDWRWTCRQRPVNMIQAFDIRTCVICLDDQARYRLLELPCNDYFCFCCFQEGWDASLFEGDPFTCCQVRIPIPTIREHLKVSDDDIERYIRTLKITDTPEPLFCPSPKCEELIGSMTELVPNRKRKIRIVCPECQIEVCSSCRQVWHVRDCVSLEEARFMREYDIRRCPYCGHLTMKDGGCPHMTCRRCKKHYWWTDEGGTREAFQGQFA